MKIPSQKMETAKDQTTSHEKSEPALVQVDRIVKRFPGVLALDEANLEIRRGEVHALLGENGAGKSTLIKLLSGVYQPDGGSISVRGKKVHLTDPHRAQALGITTIYQEHSLAPDLSAIENMFLGREMRTAGPLLNEKAMHARAQQLWAEFGGDPEDLKRPVSMLGGLKQRLIEIIKALAFDAELIIMDEPTAALPDEERDNLLAHIRKMRDSGIAVLLVTHRLEELSSVADRVTIFRDGKWVASMPMAETSISDIIRKMVGRDVGSMVTAAARPADSPLAENAAEVLTARGLTRKDVLHNVSLSVRAGEIVGIGGLAGSGRTELARAIVGADKLDSGEVKINGRTGYFAFASRRDARRDCLGPRRKKSAWNCRRFYHYQKYYHRRDAESDRSHLYARAQRTRGRSQLCQRTTDQDQQHRRTNRKSEWR